MCACVQIVEVKRKVAAAQGADAYPVAAQVLIYQGKVLKDDTSVADNSIQESGFVVVMLTKVRRTRALAAPAGGIQAGLGMGRTFLPQHIYCAAELGLSLRVFACNVLPPS